MRTTLQCRSCGARKLWRVDPVMLPQYDSKSAIYQFPAVCRSASGTTETHDWGASQVHGRFEVWICAGCAMSTEWYSVDVDASLSRLARTQGSGVSYVDGDAPRPDDR